MPGLLGDVLPWVYSRGDALKRQVGGLLSDPVGTAQQAMGLLADRDREQQGLLAQAFANPQRPFQVTDQGAMTRAAGNMLQGPLGFAPMGMIAYHGSPHVFEKFDSAKRGTGEGNAVFGHGTYLAESPQVAGNYAKLGQQKGSENLYKVDLPDDAVAKMLDWDKPIAQQQVGATISPRFFKNPENSSSERWEVIGNIGSTQKTLNAFKTKREAQQYVESMTGGSLYSALEPSLGFQTSARLREMGIPGLRYLDGGSRSTGAGSSNFVVFPGEENILTILERNGQPLR